MDFTDALKAGGASASIITIIAVAYKIVQSVCGHRLRSECCGREATIGATVEEMPPSKRASIVIEPHVDKPTEIA